MKRFAILLAYFAFMQAAGAQPCLPEGVFLSTQQQINAFRTTYPGCTEIGGDVIISGFNIWNLTGLNQITSIGGSLRIESNDILVNLAGLENLVSIGGNLYVGGNMVLTDFTGVGNLQQIGIDLQCTNNPSLVSMTGLENLVSVGGKLWIEDNDGLVDLTGLDSLSSVVGCLRIFSNDVLESLDGLDNLTAVGGNVAIGGTGHLGSLGNPSLVDLRGLHNLTSVGGFLEVACNSSLPTLAGLDNIDGGSISSLRIYQNPLLSECEVASICEFLANPGSVVVIHDNAPGCNSPAEVREACLLLPVAETDKVGQPNVFPNPAFTRAELFNLPADGDFRLSVISTEGREVLSRIIHGPTTTLDISSLHAGIWLLLLRDGRSCHTVRLVKM